MQEIDYEKLRTDLLNYFGTGFTILPLAIQMLDKIISASNEELIQIANDNSFKLDNYVMLYKKDYTM